MYKMGVIDPRLKPWASCGDYRETAAGKLEQRIAETKSDLEKQIANVRADMIKWMFIFWAGQVAVTVGLFSLFYNLLK
jgi:hypothetical protein